MSNRTAGARHLSSQNSRGTSTFRSGNDEMNTMYGLSVRAWSDFCAKQRDVSLQKTQPPESNIHPRVAPYATTCSPIAVTPCTNTQVTFMPGKQTQNVTTFILDGVIAVVYPRVSTHNIHNMDSPVENGAAAIKVVMDKSDRVTARHSLLVWIA